jgi:Flp pilus assembly protein TadB
MLALSAYLNDHPSQILVGVLAAVAVLVIVRIAVVILGVRRNRRCDRLNADCA